MEKRESMIRYCNFELDVLRPYHMESVIQKAIQRTDCLALYPVHLYRYKSLQCLESFDLGKRETAMECPSFVLNHQAASLLR